MFINQSSPGDDLKRYKKGADQRSDFNQIDIQILKLKYLEFLNILWPKIFYVK